MSPKALRWPVAPGYYHGSEAVASRCRESHGSPKVVTFIRPPAPARLLPWTEPTL